MDKKVKKKTHVLQQRIQTLRQQLAGAKKQLDDQSELKSIEQQLAAAEAELAKIKDVVKPAIGGSRRRIAVPRPPASAAVTEAVALQENARSRRLLAVGYCLYNAWYSCTGSSMPTISRILRVFFCLLPAAIAFGASRGMRRQGRSTE